MSRNREATYDALVQFLNTGLQANPRLSAMVEAPDGQSQTLTYFGPVVQRGLKHWDDVPPGDMPSIFIPNGNEEVDNSKGRGTGLPSLWMIRPSIWVYTHTNAFNRYAFLPPSDTTSAVLMNFILDSLDGLLIPDGDTERVTLGGTVQSVRIGGAVESDEGYFGPLSVAKIPLEIRAV